MANVVLRPSVLNLVFFSLPLILGWALVIVVREASLLLILSFLTLVFIRTARQKIELDGILLKVDHIWSQKVYDLRDVRHLLLSNEMFLKNGQHLEIEL